MQDNLYTLSINGVDLHVDAEDAAFMERYEAASAAVSANASDGLRTAEAIRQYCQNFRTFFDVLFGDGTAEKLFANVPDNRRAYDDVFTSLLKVIFEQRLCGELRLTEAVKRYAPKNGLV